MKVGHPEIRGTLTQEVFEFDATLDLASQPGFSSFRFVGNDVTVWTFPPAGSWQDKFIEIQNCAPGDNLQMASADGSNIRGRDNHAPEASVTLGISWVFVFQSDGTNINIRGMYRPA